MVTVAMMAMTDISDWPTALIQSSS